jgi:flagellar biosynthesis protein FlhA
VRTAEVTARFTLDAMPGKQMAIDADLNAGIINEQQARARGAGGPRSGVLRRNGWRGPLQSTRFPGHDSDHGHQHHRRFLIGVFQQGVPFQEALKTYTILTVGDGLVTILPSLLVSVAGGIVVTRAASKESLGVNVGKQLFNSPRCCGSRAGALTALGLIPGLPKLPSSAWQAVLMFAAWKMKPQVSQG